MNTQPPPPLALPPWLWPSAPAEPLGVVFPRAKWLLLAYWVLLVSGFVVLFAVFAAYEHLSGSDTAALGAFLLVSMAGVALGQLLGLLRVRPWFVQTVVLGATTASCVGLTMALGPAVVYVIGFLWSLGCGHLTLQRRGSLWSLWIPVICYAGSMITLLERHGRLHTWQSGRKEGVWEPVTLAILLLFVLQVFAFLATQEHYHTLVWRSHGANAPPKVTTHKGGGARMTGRGLGALVLLGAVVTAAVALVSPYLWRTEHRDGPRDPPPQAEPEPDPQRRPGRDDFDWDRVGQALRRAAREAQERSREVLPFLPLFLLHRPLRRLLLLRHLRKPFWRLSPTERARNLWRYVRIGLDDGKLGPRPGEPLEDLVHRVETTREKQSLPPTEGLRDVVDLTGRIQFGLGIPEGALETLEARALTTYKSLVRPLPLLQRVGSWWRKLG